MSLGLAPASRSRRTNSPGLRVDLRHGVIEPVRHPHGPGLIAIPLRPFPTGDPLRALVQSAGRSGRRCRVPVHATHTNPLPTAIAVGSPSTGIVCGAPGGRVHARDGVVEAVHDPERPEARLQSARCRHRRAPARRAGCWRDRSLPPSSRRSARARCRCRGRAERERSRDGSRARHAEIGESPPAPTGREAWHARRPDRGTSSSAGSCWRIARSSSRSSGPGSTPACSSSSARPSRKRSRASTWRPARYRASISCARERSCSGFSLYSMLELRISCRCWPSASAQSIRSSAGEAALLIEPLRLDAPRLSRDDVRAAPYAAAARFRDPRSPTCGFSEAGMWPMFVVAWPRSRLRWIDDVRAPPHATLFSVPRTTLLSCVFLEAGTAWRTGAAPPAAPTATIPKREGCRDGECRGGREDQVRVHHGRRRLVARQGHHRRLARDVAEGARPQGRRPEARSVHQRRPGHDVALPAR